MSNKNQHNCTRLLFILYLFMLVWIVIFKCNFNLWQVDRFRNVNLTLYMNSPITDEMMLNVLLFIPFGIYISMLKIEWPSVKRVIIICMMSFLFEMTQYVFMIGATDITDIVGNTLGGYVGILIYYVSSWLIKERTNTVLNKIALLSTMILMPSLLIVRLFHI